MSVNSSLLLLALMIGNLAELPKIRDKFVVNPPSYREQPLDEVVPTVVVYGKLVVVAKVSSEEWGVSGQIEHTPLNDPPGAPAVYNNLTNNGTTWELTWTDYAQLTGTGTTILRLTVSKPGQSIQYTFPLTVVATAVGSPPPPAKVGK